VDAGCQPIKHHENTALVPKGRHALKSIENRSPISPSVFGTSPRLVHDTYRPFGTTATIGRVTNPGLASGAVACRGFATSPEGTPCNSHGCQPMEPGPTREPGRQTRAPVPKGRHAIAMGANPWNRPQPVYRGRKTRAPVPKGRHAIAMGANPWTRGANPCTAVGKHAHQSRRDDM
jgi:hypothetical protein